MEPLSMTPARRQSIHHAYGRTADAFETVAWRPPGARRFNPRPANDGCHSGTARSEMSEAFSGIPAWLHIVGGGLAAALMGALLGGALQV